MLFCKIHGRFDKRVEICEILESGNGNIRIFFRDLFTPVRRPVVAQLIFRGIQTFHFLVVDTAGHERLQLLVYFFYPEFAAYVGRFSAAPEKDGAVRYAQVLGKQCNVAVIIAGPIDRIKNFRSDFHISFSLFYGIFPIERI